MKVKQIIVTNIQWDTDGEKVDLPKKVTIDINEDNIDLLEDIYGYADNVVDYLSDKYEFCINSCDIKVK